MKRLRNCHRLAALAVLGGSCVFQFGGCTGNLQQTVLAAAAESLALTAAATGQGIVANLLSPLLGF